MAKICIPVREKSLTGLKKSIAQAALKADLIEIWLDTLPAGITPGQILGLTARPVIVVNKRKKERGDFRGTEARRIKILADYAAAGADYVDVAADLKPALLKAVLARKSARTKMILSYHDFRKTPSSARLKELRDKAFRAGAHIFKAAVFAQNYEDNLTVLEFLAASRRAGKPVIAHCMGEKGRISRVLAHVFGSYIIYIAPGKNRATAPGQLTADEYRKITSLLNI
jgi:3-dehydroquinate dehydratase type I